MSLFGLVLGPRGALRKDFFCFFFGGAFFCCCWGACSSFLLLFSVPALSGSCFSSFFWCFLFLFCPRGGASCCSFFSLFFWGLFLFVFLLFFGGFLSFFLLLRGLFLLWVPFLGQRVLGSNRVLLSRDFFFFFWFFFGGGR